MKPSGSTSPRRLEVFFTPARIAIVGASERGMYPAGILRNLIDGGYAGEIYPINPNRSTVFGLSCYPDLTQTPHPADLAIITVPRQAVLPALQQCQSAGVPAAVIITAGFAEADAEGRELQAQMRALLDSGSLAVIGPNCAGVANIPARVIAARLPAPPRAGAVSFVSASGALMMALYGLYADRQIGMNRLVSLGNQVDVTLAECLNTLAAEPQTGVIAAFVEGLGRGGGPEFTAALRSALIAGKPVVMIKSGRTASGQRAAATHTAALAGADRVFDGVLEQFGVMRVEDVRELIDTTHLFAALSRRLEGRGRIAVVTQSGGLGALAADLIEAAGLSLLALSGRLQSQLRALAHLRSLSELGNPADVQGASVAGAATAETLAPFLADPDSDVVLLLLAKSAVREEDAATAEAIIQAAKEFDKPLVVVWTGQRYPTIPTERPLAHRRLVEAGIPFFEQPSDAVRALGRAIGYWRFRAGWLDDPEMQHAG